MELVDLEAAIARAEQAKRNLIAACKVDGPNDRGVVNVTLALHEISEIAKCLAPPTR